MSGRMWYGTKGQAYTLALIWVVDSQLAASGQMLSHSSVRGNVPHPRTFKANHCNFGGNRIRSARGGS